MSTCAYHAHRRGVGNENWRATAFILNVLTLLVVLCLLALDRGSGAPTRSSQAASDAASLSLLSCPGLRRGSLACQWSQLALADGQRGPTPASQDLTGQDDNALVLAFTAEDHLCFALFLLAATAAHPPVDSAVRSFDDQVRAAQGEQAGRQPGRMRLTAAQFDYMKMHRLTLRTPRAGLTLWTVRSARGC